MFILFVFLELFVLTINTVSITRNKNIKVAVRPANKFLAYTVKTIIMSNMPGISLYILKYKFVLLCFDHNVLNH